MDGGNPEDDEEDEDNKKKKKRKQGQDEYDSLLVEGASQPCAVRRFAELVGSHTTKTSGATHAWRTSV